LYIKQINAGPIPTCRLYKLQETELSKYIEVLFQ